MSQNGLFRFFPRGLTMNFGNNPADNKKGSPVSITINLHLRSNTPRKIPLDKKAIGFGAAGAGLVAVLSPFVVAAANGKLPEHVLSIKQKTGEVVRTVGCTLASDGNACLQQIIQDRPR